MALRIRTSDPSGLLTAIKSAIDKGHVATWEYDSDADFTHSPPQWNGQAWFRPAAGGSTLRFGLLGQQGVQMTTEVYAIYHGRFIEMLLAHFDKKFSAAEASAQFEVPDNF
jgi:hypothetical protein